MAILPDLGLPTPFCTRQTGICLYALLDDRPRRGLLPGKRTLADGARVHDILQFARVELGMRVAENTRETYRKTSLRPLNEIGVINRHQLSTNDPNTFYRISVMLVEPLLAVIAGKGGQGMPEVFRQQAAKGTMREGEQPVEVQVSRDKTFVLSAGAHSLLIKDVVEKCGTAFLAEPQVVYIGDTAKKSGYRQVMRELNLPVEIKAGLPDVIIFSETQKRLIVCEAVTSSGPITSSRLEQLLALVQGPGKLGYSVVFVTAFPSRAVLRRFVEGIAWGSAVWIAAEPNNLVLFQERGGER